MSDKDALVAVRRYEGRLTSNGWTDESRQVYVRGPDHDETIASRDATISRLTKERDEALAAGRTLVEECDRFRNGGNAALSRAQRMEEALKDMLQVEPEDPGHVHTIRAYASARAALTPKAGEGA